MGNSDTQSVSSIENVSVEAKPDIAFVKLHIVGEGVSVTDAVEGAQRKVKELSESLRAAHKQIKDIDVYDVYLGQKQDRLGSEAQTYPRPLVVRGILISASPDDPASLHRILDDGVKKGALLSNPHRNSYINNALDSALLFGLIGSEEHERRAVEECLKRAEKRCKNLAAAAGKKIVGLLDIFNVSVESCVGDPFPKDFGHIKRSFPTRFLSPTPSKVLVCASLTARYIVGDL